MNRRKNKILLALVAIQGTLLGWNLASLGGLGGLHEPRWVTFVADGLACVSVWFAWRYFYLPAWRWRRQRRLPYIKGEAWAAQRRDDLLMLLDPENRARLQRKQPLEIIGSEGGKYLIARGYTYNVLKCGDGYQVRYCANVPSYISISLELYSPDNFDALIYTTMIAQVLVLTTDEKAFLRVAIRGGATR